jgi:hypothetical protein
MESPGATFVSRELADKAVKLWADFGIVSEVVADGRYWRVLIYPKSGSVLERKNPAESASTFSVVVKRKSSPHRGQSGLSH